MNLGAHEFASVTFAGGGEGLSARAHSFIALDCFATAQTQRGSVLWMESVDILVGDEMPDIELTAEPDVGVEL